MIRTIDEIIYYPSTRKVITQELRSAIGLYQKHEMTNDQFYFLISHYVENFSYLLFSDDYEIHGTIRNQLGVRSTRMLEAVILEIKKTREKEE